jgi:hypothetical protein
MEDYLSQIIHLLVSHTHGDPKITESCAPRHRFKNPFTMSKMRGADLHDLPAEAGYVVFIPGIIGGAAKNARQPEELAITVWWSLSGSNR